MQYNVQKLKNSLSWGNVGQMSVRYYHAQAARNLHIVVKFILLRRYDDLEPRKLLLYYYYYYYQNISLSYIVVLWLLITMVLSVILCDGWKWVKT